MVPPPLEPEEIECDLYMCTHNHGDHTDLKSIPRITKKNDIMFVGPRNVIKSLLKLGISREKICEVNVGDLLELESIKIRGTFCIPTDDTVLDSEGFLLQTEDGVTIYHTGDTGFHEFLFYLSKYPIDIMMVCINGGMGNMNIEEAVRLTRLLRPRVVIPNHYGMFAHNTDDPVRFRVRLAGTGAEAPCEILKMGEKYVYTRMES
jgi:L-ascorbate 6-phosphate lactonase